jgi:carbohydrate kinase (thermoresistant glucokinase family)
MAEAILLMGVAGAGKTTIGRLLSAELGWPFYDGDDFMPEANVAKMASGQPLNDEDRKPWLAILNQLMRDHLADGRCLIVGASALKRSYRQQLAEGITSGQLHFVHLQGDYHLLEQRLKDRTGHFMKAGMLTSQLATLEEPHRALDIDIRLTPPEIVTTILTALKLKRGDASRNPSVLEED